MIMVDTTVWIDYFKDLRTPEHRALERLIINGNPMICLTDIIQTEILQGIRSDADHANAIHYFQQMPCLTAKAPSTFIHAAELYRRCRKNGVTIRSTVDCLIAAVCIENKASLLHHDSDFDHLAKHCGLKKTNPASILKPLSKKKP
jgi:predicted nucleic acid-binding protein